MSWAIETGEGRSSYASLSEYTRAWDAWAAWDAITLEPGQKKRMLRRGRVVRREIRLPDPVSQPVAQEALWT